MQARYQRPTKTSRISTKINRRHHHHYGGTDYNHHGIGHNGIDHCCIDYHGYRRPGTHDINGWATQMDRDGVPN